MHTIYRTTEDTVGFLLHYSDTLIYSGLLDTIFRYLLMAKSSHWSDVRKISVLLCEVP